MANRKEEEKNEKIIRNLLKLPDNRRCINCNSLGPQYVCTNFWTFICTTCSGIHREFTHRVKSVSMAKFTSQEVSALQGGGNASAKEIYLKEWDPQRQSLPDGSNVERLRDFIKHVYVDRRYTGERSFEKPPRVKGESEDFNEHRRMDTYQGGSRSPPYEDTYDRRYGDRASPGGRSPGYDVDNRQYGDFKKSPGRVDVVNDWRRDDRFGNGKRSEDSRASDGGSRLENKSPDRQSLEMSSPPAVRPVREILGDNVSPLRVIEPPKADGGKSNVSRTQRTASSSSLASSNGNPVELKTETSLIDFDAVSETPASGAVVQTPELATGTSIVQPTTSSADNWANFDSVPQVKVSQTPVNTNPLESMLSGLSVPTPITGPSVNVSIVPGSNSAFGDFGPAAAPVRKPVAFPLGGIPSAATGPTSILATGTGNSFVNTAGGQWPNMQPQQPQQHLFFPGTGGQPFSQPSIAPAGGAASNQHWNPIVPPNVQGPSSVSTVQLSQGASNPVIEAASGAAAQPAPMEPKSVGRKALPEDLFTMNYAAIPAVIPGWHMGPPHGIGFGMQYNMATMTMPMYMQQSKSTNPFDVSSEPTPIQAPVFPSMASLQGALPNMAVPTGLLRTSSLGTPTPHSSLMGPHPPPYASSFVQGSYMGQQVASNIPPRPHGSLNPNQPPSGLYSTPAAQNGGGNPFG